MPSEMIFLNVPLRKSFFFICSVSGQYFFFCNIKLGPRKPKLVNLPNVSDFNSIKADMLTNIKHLHGLQ